MDDYGYRMVVDNTFGSGLAADMTTKEMEITNTKEEFIIIIDITCLSNVCLL